MPTKSRILTMYRVPYGKKTTPLELREYHEGLNSPVGSISEIVAHYKDKGYVGCQFIGHDGEIDKIVLF